ncbi:MAG: AAA family ATPase, partial [Gemmatimonadetes bacterium]|nr:AAA family ATPase [Gemmatimonadota bacterium]
MPIIPLFGHGALRDRLAESALRGTLPSSLLVHGPRGVGKQRLALWLATLLLCDQADAPCGACPNCKLSFELAHPDLTWVFPRTRDDDGSDDSPDEVMGNLGDAVTSRCEANGLYPAPPGNAGIFIGATRAIVREGLRRPAMARRRVIVVGEADRMAQGGHEESANAFLKLLEEPPAGTMLILTSSEPGALLPTIRSRVVSVAARPLGDADVQRFVEHPLVAAHLDKAGTEPVAARVRRARGLPGALLNAADVSAARENAARILAAAGSDRAERYRAAFVQGATGARGAFSDTLDALVVLLRERMEGALAQGDVRRSRAAARAIPAVLATAERAQGN